MTPHYDSFLVGVSLLISVVSAWLALELSNRVHVQIDRAMRAAWLGLGSVVMGTGIWAMHYVAMLAYKIPVQVQYHWPTVLVSLTAAVVASAAALYLVSRPVMQLSMTVVGSLFMGTAIAGMHYIGMAAMRMPCRLTYNKPLVALSVLLADAISLVALRLCFLGKSDIGLVSRRRLGSAALMGAAIPVVHYVGMAAVHMSDAGAANSSYAHALTFAFKDIVWIAASVLALVAVATILAVLNRSSIVAAQTIARQEREQSEAFMYQQRLRDAFRRSGVGAWECDPSTGLFLADDRLMEMYDVVEHGNPIPRELWRSRVHPDDLSLLDQRWKAALRQGSVYENEYRVVRRNGEERTYRSVGTISRDAEGHPIQVSGMSWDVTEERQQQRVYQEQEERFSRTLEAIADGVIVVNAQGLITYLNPVAVKILGRSREECLGQNLMEVFRAEDENTGKPRCNPIDLCHHHGGELFTEDDVLVDRQGKRFNIRKRVTLLQGDGGVITFQDISAERAAAKALQHTATHDNLTGIPNRSSFEAALAHVWNHERGEGQTHCLGLLDLDRFKIVNDTSGHMAGDALLKQVVRTLKAHLVKGDILARMGGDEFLLLLRNRALHRAQAVVQRMLAAVERQPFIWHGQTYHVSASVGMVKFDKTTPSYEALIGEADMAMFAAKRSGRNQVALFQQEHGGAVLQEMEVLAQLRSALEQDRFELHAQPIVPVRNIAHKTHFEVLVRMRDANGALVSPAAFIPTAEKYGMMDKLDRWVIQHVLQTYAAYPRLGDLHFAINLSAQSLSDPALWPFVSQQFRSTSVPPHTITFEVTETGIIENMETANSFLRQVRGLGCAVALDDFGTGLSSLSYLKMFTLDYLKIDGSFIRELRQNPLDQSIVRATSQIAHTMQASTVGECAEDLETIELLAELGVDCVQGWAAGRPVLLQTTLEQHAATAALAGTQDRHPADEHATASLAATGRLALA